MRIDFDLTWTIWGLGLVIGKDTEGWGGAMQLGPLVIQIGGK